MVGLQNSHIRKVLTQNGEPQRSSWGKQKKKKEKIGSHVDFETIMRSFNIHFGGVGDYSMASSFHICSDHAEGWEIIPWHHHFTFVLIILLSVCVLKLLCPFNHLVGLVVKVSPREHIEGSRPEWCISGMIYSRDTPFW